jgi:hypothetical protein
MFGIWVYSDELQIKFTFRSGPMIFGRVMALGLWNLAKYLVITNFFRYAWRYWLDFWKIIGPERNINLNCNSSLYTYTPKKQVNISKYSEKKWWQLNIWPNFKVHNSAKNHWTGGPWTLKFGQIFSYHQFFSLCLEILTWFLVWECI